jgi:hypothetical protein
MASIDSIARRMAPWSARPVAGCGRRVGRDVSRRSANQEWFRLHQLEARYERAGTFVGRRLPSNAIVITSSQSGASGFTGPPHAVWDMPIQHGWTPRYRVFADAWTEPFLLLETGEEPSFRRRLFRARSEGWTGPAAEVSSRKVRAFIGPMTAKSISRASTRLPEHAQ